MIINSRQSWEIGEIVKIGFLKLRVIQKIPTPGDSMPDEYHLCGLGDNSSRIYSFVPYNGLTRLK